MQNTTSIYGSVCAAQALGVTGLPQEEATFRNLRSSSEAYGYWELGDCALSYEYCI